MTGLRPPAQAAPGGELKAGPGLDRLVAEKVMGWVLAPHPTKGFMCWSANGKPIVPEGGIGFSRTIGWAWEVLRACVWHEMPVHVHFSLNGFDVTIDGHSQGCETPCDAKDQVDAPLAICCAALAAMATCANPNPHPYLGTPSAIGPTAPPSGSGDAP